MAAPAPAPATDVVPESFIYSKVLGVISHDRSNELFLPAGLPGFEDEQAFLPVEIPARRPLVFLQSVKSSEVCFVCLPVSSIEPGLSVTLSEEDRAALELPHHMNLVMGEDILCLALLLPSDETVRTNLDAPIVINLHNYRCAQVLPGARQGFRRLTAAGEWEPIC